MRAFITGISGQDGSHLTEFLLGKGYKVVGLLRRSSTPNIKNIIHLLDKIDIEYGDISDQSNLDFIINKYQPDEVYNLAAMSFVPVSWKSPTYTMTVNTIGPLMLLESIRQHKPDARFYFAGSSEQYGKVVEIPQNENTPFYPRSPYGVSKCAGFWLTKNYRESYNLFACSGIAFNHTSPRRGIEFVCKKITNSAAKIKCGISDKLYLGNIESKRDWSHAKDVTKAMWMMLQNDEPDDFVIGSDNTHPIKELCELAFNYVGLDYRDYLEIDPKFFRPAEVDILLSDSSKIRNTLGWKPEYTFKQLIEEMVEDDLNNYGKK